MREGLEYLVRDCNIRFSFSVLLCFLFYMWRRGRKMGIFEEFWEFLQGTKETKHDWGSLYGLLSLYSVDGQAGVLASVVYILFFFLVSPCQSTHLRYHTNCILIFSALNTISPCLRNDMIMSFHLAFLPELDHPDWYQLREL